MSSKSIMNYRMVDRKSVTNDFNIERFAYDVFAYMLRMCGLPENKIPTSDLKGNTYIEDDFVMNIGLSALPIALFKRDEWRTMFESITTKNITENFLNIRYSLESYLSTCWEEEDEDTQSKVQFSLALYTEFILYQNSKNPETYFGRFPILWSCLCKKLLTENEDPDLTFEFSLIMCPDVSESWITNFMRKFEIPYGNKNVSELFSVYALKGPTEMDFFEETSTESITNKQEEIVPRPSNVSDEYSKRFHTENTDSGLNFMLGRLERPSEQTSNLYFFRTSAISNEDPTTLFPENIDSTSTHLPGRSNLSSGHIQASKEYVFPPSTPEDSIISFAENTNSGNNFMLRWKGSSGHIQASKEYVFPPSTPEEDSIKFLDENTNFGNNSEQRHWEEFLVKLQTSTKYDPQLSGISDEISSNIFHKNTDTAVNYIPGRRGKSSRYLPTYKEYTPQSFDTSDEYSIKFFAGNSISESNAGVNYIPGRCDESSMNLQTDNESSLLSSGASDEYSVKFFQGNTYLESNVIPGRWNLPRSSDQQPISEKSARVKTKAYGRSINGLTYVIKQCMKKRKRNISEKLDVDDCFEKMNIDEEKVSPENLDTKRRKIISDTID